MSKDTLATWFAKIAKNQLATIVVFIFGCGVGWQFINGAIVDFGDFKKVYKEDQIEQKVSRKEIMNKLNKNGEVAHRIENHVNVHEVRLNYVEREIEELKSDKDDGR